jgi:hypothetical protein
MKGVSWGVVAASLLLNGCGLVKSYEPFRYRLTVEVDTPQGLRAGSSVIEVTAGEVGTTLGGANATARGEAVAVDLPGGQTLFALLRGEDVTDFAAGVMFGVSPVPKDGAPDKGIAAEVAAARKNKKLNVVPRTYPPFYSPNDPPISAYPMLVTFRDITDPKTVERVDPDNLAASFGPSVKLRQITVQLTEDAVTTGIEKRFAWWQKHKNLHFDGTSNTIEYMTKKELSAHLSSGSFSTEQIK